MNRRARLLLATLLWRRRMAVGLSMVLPGAILLLTACGAGSDGPTTASPATAFDCGAQCATDALSVSDVERVLAQGVDAARRKGAAATIAVTDRVGNVLGVYTMTSALPRFRIDGGRSVQGGLEQVDVLPASFAAISKALTAAYLSSAGNAFSTRTASQIVQENFNPREANQPSGPLFGVQFSQLPCSDLVQRFADGSVGPKRSPLGLAADPGGLPLYRNGRVVGGVGVMADGVYGVDLDIADLDVAVDETLAAAASAGFEAPLPIRADRITLDGRTARFSDAADVPAGPVSLAGMPGILTAVAGYFSGVLQAGSALGLPASGIRRDTGVFADLNGYVLVDSADSQRYPPRAGTDGFLSSAEVRTLLRSSLSVANRTRAQIRQPASQAAQVSVTVVDTQGVVLGLVRTPDAPVFGTDVALQKARSAAWFSSANAAANLQALPPANYLQPVATSSPASYLSVLRSLLGDATALSNGMAFSTRAISGLARPFLPDGVSGTANGPLSKPYTQWSPFSTGLQLDLSLNGLVAAAGGSADRNCTGIASLPNGLQIFAGGIPIYRRTGSSYTLVGAIGVSGDGVDQDDMIAYLGVSEAATTLNTGLGHAPAALRSDTLTVPGGKLRYMQCPQSPFLQGNAQNVCPAN